MGAGRLGFFTSGLVGLALWFWAAQGQAALPDLAQLEVQATRVADVQEIKRLQRAYGYYLDRSEWDEVVDLLTEDVTAEYGPGGVYVGKAQVRALLYGIGYGARGLRPGQLREHIQLQPVITLAEDGLTAEGRWRVLGLLGQFNEYARWQAGPYENRYRKVDGRWRISAIHWAETFTVPFAGGWAGHMPQSNVADRKLPPADRPSTYPMQPWPVVSELPHHFRVTSVGRTPVGGWTGPRTTAGSTAARVVALRSLVDRLDDEQQIEILQRTYGYYVDKNLWEQIADLFTADGTLEIGGRGVFVGRERVLQYLKWLGDGVDGRLYDHTQMQPIVHVSPDGLQAKGRWRALVFGGDLGRTSVFGDCIYENEYRKENGVWKIARLYSYFIMYTNLDKGWGVMAWPNTRPEKSLPPDRPPTRVYDMYPGALTAPYHYANLVTGSPVYAPAAPLKADKQPGRRDLQQLQRRIEALADLQAIENVQNAYGWYLDKWRWDEAAALFADDGSWEWGDRGVYVGRNRIRQAMDLEGPAGLRHGQVNDRIFYQPVIHRSADGLSAKVRVRQLLMTGTHGGTAQLGGAVHENTFSKRDGVWKIQTDHGFVTFLADYAKGWSHGALPAPGRSVTLPPDRPATTDYQPFPAFRPVPFHYPNPVTGRDPVGHSP